jgi:hypothetical protein
LTRDLAEGEFQTQIQAALTSEWAERVKGIWTTRLDSIVNIAQTKVEDVITILQAGTNQAEDEADVDAFAFSDLAYPAIPTTALTSGGPSSSLAPFLSSLKQRSSGRTPLLDGVLGSLEKAASALSNDVEGLEGDLKALYHAGVGDALRRFLVVLRGSLSSVGQDGAVESSLFVGRIALYLATTSSVLSDLVGSAKDISGKLPISTPP